MGPGKGQEIIHLNLGDCPLGKEYVESLDVFGDILKVYKKLVRQDGLKTKLLLEATASRQARQLYSRGFLDTPALPGPAIFGL